MCSRVRLRLGCWHRYVITIIFDSCKTLSRTVALICDYV
ncbi:hypothetical protein F383_38559 [Gossypium arboreum]|uniref:Uncharacterized protein n=1 Tax=Gossypium arboreum TaxID=29729 RepID=A0A0B0ML42_GOSAR|nr:hypothetical protein F383_38559 [Gossypium arboreum]